MSGCSGAPLDLAAVSLRLTMPFCHGLCSKLSQSEEVSQKLQLLLSVFASKRLSGLYRFLARYKQCYQQAGNQLRTLACFLELSTPRDLVFVLTPLLGLRHGVFANALLFVGIKMRALSSRNTAPLPMLKWCSFQSQCFGFFQVVLFSRLSCRFVLRV